MATKARNERTKNTATETNSRISSTESGMVECTGFTEAGKGVVTQRGEVANDNKLTIKKFFHRLKESIGIAERTQFSKKLSDAMEHLDRYKLCLDRLSDALYTATQENGRFRTTEPKMDLAPPLKQDQYEMVAACLNNNTSFGNYANYKEQILLYQKQATEHRDYLRRARRALHNIRTFIQHDYWVIAIQRTELDSLRSEMDFAKADLGTTKEPQLVEAKTKAYNKAVAAYEEKLAIVTSLMDAFPKNKTSHLTDILDWAKCTREYHEKMAKLLEGEAKKEA